jgi:EAL domain-containing protein (putative c-di-GMP-specific phosphodiesterase class I)
VDTTAAILQSLRERGVRVAVDDFGTGYSSLSYLRKFPVDALKIDQSFIRQITGEGRDTTLVTAVINMARSLKLRVIAEGVENGEELDFIRDHECDEAQGYHFSHPVPASEFIAILAGAGGDPLPQLTGGVASTRTSGHATSGPSVPSRRSSGPAVGRATRAMRVARHH